LVVTLAKPEISVHLRPTYLGRRGAANTRSEVANVRRLMSAPGHLGHDRFGDDHEHAGALRPTEREAPGPVKLLRVAPSPRRRRDVLGDLGSVQRLSQSTPAKWRLDLP
jgi:hypothetical protein